MKTWQRSPEEIREVSLYPDERVTAFELLQRTTYKGEVMLRCAVLSFAILQSARLFAATELGVEGSRFTINGKPAFLLGISYYGALGAPDSFVAADLQDIDRAGFNWIRVWATWVALGTDVSALNADGSARAPFLGRLEKIITDCDARGIIVDVTLSPEHHATGAGRLRTAEEHRRAVETLIEALKGKRNWSLDLANERNIRDARFVSEETLKHLRDRVEELDPKRLVTASHSSSDEEFVDEFDSYLKTIRVDFITPHRPRSQGTPDQTEAATGHFLERMKALGRVVPILYQEPFRRGWGEWEPDVNDFLQDFRGAVRGGAAGWCFHNGAERRGAKVPQRSFDLREQRLFDQLDPIEKTVVARLKSILVEQSGSAK